jgi:hypothetical protein
MLVARKHRGRSDRKFKDAIREYLTVVEEQLRGENVSEIEVSV